MTHITHNKEEYLDNMTDYFFFNQEKVEPFCREIIDEIINDHKKFEKPTQTINGLERAGYIHIFSIFSNLNPKNLDYIMVYCIDNKKYQLLANMFLSNEPNLVRKMYEFMSSNNQYFAIFKELPSKHDFEF